MQKQTSIINELQDGTVFIQKIYSTSHFLCLSLRSVGKTQYLYIGRGGGYEGIWVADEKPISFLRKRDAFLEYLRKFLSATQFLELTMDTEDRIFTLKYNKWRVTNQLSFFYKGRRLYFAHQFYSQKQQGMQVFKSWAPNEVSNTDMDANIFDEVGRKTLADKESSAKKLISIEKLLEAEESLASASPMATKSKKFVKRKIERIEGDLAQVKKWSELQEVAQTHDNFESFDKKCKILGIKMNFKEKEHYKRRNELFDKVKKLKKAEGILEERLKKTSSTTPLKLDDRENSLVPIRPYWNQNKKSDHTTSSEVSKGNFKLFKFKGFDLGIGTSANGNDEMRKSWAHKDDLWFHLEDVKSPHIIVKLGSSLLEESILKIIGSVMIEYSEFEFSEANLIYTQVKNLKGVTGAPGKVIFKKEKHIKVICDDNWRNLLSES